MQTAAPGNGPDLTGLQPLYTAAISRTLRWVLGAAFALNAVAAILRLTNDPDGVDVAFALVQLVCYGLRLLATIALPQPFD